MKDYQKQPLDHCDRKRIIMHARRCGKTATMLEFAKRYKEIAQTCDKPEYFQVATEARSER